MDQADKLILLLYHSLSEASTVQKIPGSILFLMFFIWSFTRTPLFRFFTRKISGLN